MISEKPDIYKLYSIDCRMLFDKMKSNSVDLILTDPPYNISQHSRGNIVRYGKSTLNNDIAEWDKIKINPKEYVASFKRILKPNGNIIVFAGYNQFGEWYDAFNGVFDTLQVFVWHKTNPPPKVFKNGFCNSCEFAVMLWNKGHKWNFSTQDEMHNFYECSICSAPERIRNPFHPTQKPLKLINHLLKISSNQGDVVFDPFMGVGTTGVSAIMNKRKFVGCDIDPIYVSAANSRIVKLFH